MQKDIFWHFCFSFNDNVHFNQNIVSEIFVDAFSKLKPCRTPTGPPIVLDVTSGESHYFWMESAFLLVILNCKSNRNASLIFIVTPLSKSPTPQSPVTVKRKAIEDSLPELEGSAKKRYICYLSDT